MNKARHFLLGVLFFALVMLVTVRPSLAQNALNAEGVLLLGSSGSAEESALLARFQLVGTRREAGKLEVVRVRDNDKFANALRVTTHNDPGSEWGIQATLTLDKPIEKDDVLLASFWLRCVDSMTGEGFTGFVVEQNKEPFDKAAELRVGAPGTWTEIFIPFRAPQDFKPGETQLCFRAGYDRQTIEIAGIRVVNYGKRAEIEQLPRTSLTYAGRAADAPWRKAALERIEQIRKGDLTVKVVDGTGKPVSGASVHVKLSRHAFGFGSCVTVGQITGTSSDDARAREIIEKYFNRVVFENDMKWPAMWDGPTPQLDAAVDWLRARNIEVRGHNLQWPSWQWSPRQLRDYEKNPAELRRLCEKRVTDTVSHFKGKLVAWDVVNEPYNNVDLLNILGRDVMVDWFKLARAADPDVELYLNDFGIFDGGTGSDHRRHFYETIRFLKNSGAPINGVGIQSHFGAVMPGPTQLLSVLDQFSEFGFPIESTEFSLNTDDRQLQAEYMRDYMIALFSHPQVKSIILWGFWEGRHWRPNAALWTQDWQPLPHGQAWLDLVASEWQTDVTARAASDGQAKVRGFLGTYDVAVTLGDRTVKATAKLDRSGSAVTVVLP